jgi:uncharacterized protein
MTRSPGSPRRHDRYRQLSPLRGREGVADSHILLGDPMLGLRVYKRADFEKIWNGVAFLIRERDDDATYNNPDEWRPYAPTPWSTAMAAVRLGCRPEIDPLYQIAPIFNLDSVLP